MLQGGYTSFVDVFYILLGHVKRIVPYHTIERYEKGKCQFSGGSLEPHAPLMLLCVFQPYINNEYASKNL